MTERELKEARINFYRELEGQKRILKCLRCSGSEEFARDFLNVTPEKIEQVDRDTILRNTFLSNFQNTEKSGNIMIYMNRIKRINDKIDDGQPDLTSVNWEACENIPEGLENQSLTEKEKLMGLRIYSLYCDLETNRPLLLGDFTEKRFDWCENILVLPNYTPRTENYHYNSASLEKISKGAMTDAFNQLQLFYFKTLLNDDSPEEAITRVRNLKKEELEKICLSK